MAEQKAPNWKDHLSSIPTNTANAPYKSGTKTLGAKELAAANARHAAQMALEREKLALSQWETQMRHNLSMMEFQALQADRARGWDFADRELALKYRDDPYGTPPGINPEIVTGLLGGGQRVITPREEAQTYGKEMLNRISRGLYAPGM